MHLGGMMNIQKGMFDNAAIEKYKVVSKVMESKKKVWMYTKNMQ